MYTFHSYRGHFHIIKPPAIYSLNKHTHTYMYTQQLSILSENYKLIYFYRESLRKFWDSCDEVVT
jgi:hypothetical protein